MGYRYRRRGYRTPYHVAKSRNDYSRLRSLFGNAVKDIQAAFFQLDSVSLDRLFREYGQRHGSSAEEYARNTYRSWRSGSTGLAGQTMERLVQLVPPYLDQSTKLGVLGKVLEHNRPSRSHRTININVKEPEAGLSALREAVNGVRSQDVLSHIPENVMAAATWLYDDDVTVVRAMLAQATRQESEAMKAQADREVALLERTIRSGQIQTANYSIEFPTASISVHASVPSKCFVATVAFGSDAPETWTLRRYRDSVLRRSRLGRATIRWYYTNGPTIADYVAEHQMVRAASTGVLRTLTRILSKLYQLD